MLMLMVLGVHDEADAPKSERRLGRAHWAADWGSTSGFAQ